MKDFSKTTISSLRSKGITLVGLTAIPGTGDMPFANADRGYILNDNGCSKVRTFTQVLEMAA